METWTNNHQHMRCWLVIRSLLVFLFNMYLRFVMIGPAILLNLAEQIYRDKELTQTANLFKVEGGTEAGGQTVPPGRESWTIQKVQPPCTHEPHTKRICLKCAH